MMRASQVFSKYDVEEKHKRDEKIRKLYRAGVEEAEIAARFGLAKTTVNRIINRPRREP